MYILPVNKCKELDKYTIDNIGIPSIVLMENAAHEVANRIKGKAENFLVICGGGNNGGDGLAIARKLILQEKSVKVIIVNEKNKYTDDFNTNLRILKEMKCSLEYIQNNEKINMLQNMLNKCDIVVDCIFGVGLNRNLNDFYINIIRTINNCKAFKISVDVPSGINADTGISMGNAVKADITYTFEVIKKGFIEYRALEYLGELEIISIGIPKAVKDMHNVKIVTLDKKDYSYMLNKRNLYGHK
ncbi:NAD(P)H-hydrate epimerase [Clostridium chauvoei]|nr:NAD(P)H-hydrate epimerase [Clostridium chauvoei]